MLPFLLLFVTVLPHQVSPAHSVPSLFLSTRAPFIVPLWFTSYTGNDGMISWRCVVNVFYLTTDTSMVME